MEAIFIIGRVFVITLVLVAPNILFADTQNSPGFRSTIPTTNPDFANQNNIDWVAENSLTAISAGGSCPDGYSCEVTVHDKGMLQRELVPTANDLVIYGSKPILELLLGEQEGNSQLFSEVQILRGRANTTNHIKMRSDLSDPSRGLTENVMEMATGYFSGHAWTDINQPFRPPVSPEGELDIYLGSPHVAIDSPAVHHPNYNLTRTQGSGSTATWVDPVDSDFDTSDIPRDINLVKNPSTGEWEVQELTTDDDFVNLRLRQVVDTRSATDGSGNITTFDHTSRKFRALNANGDWEYLSNDADAVESKTIITSDTQLQGESGIGSNDATYSRFAHFSHLGVAQDSTIMRELGSRTYTEQEIRLGLQDVNYSNTVGLRGNQIQAGSLTMPGSNGGSISWIDVPNPLTDAEAVERGNYEVSSAFIGSRQDSLPGSFAHQSVYVDQNPTGLGTRVYSTGGDGLAQRAGTLINAGTADETFTTFAWDTSLGDQPVVAPRGQVGEAPVLGTNYVMAPPTPATVTPTVLPPMVAASASPTPVSDNEPFIAPSFRTDGSRTQLLADVVATECGSGGAFDGQCKVLINEADLIQTEITQNGQTYYWTLIGSKSKDRFMPPSATVYTFTPSESTTVLSESYIALGEKGIKLRQDMADAFVTRTQGESVFFTGAFDTRNSASVAGMTMDPDQNVLARSIDGSEMVSVRIATATGEGFRDVNDQDSWQESGRFDFTAKHVAVGDVDPTDVSGNTLIDWSSKNLGKQSKSEVKVHVVGGYVSGEGTWFNPADPGIHKRSELIVQNRNVYDGNGEQYQTGKHVLVSSAKSLNGLNDQNVVTAHVVQASGDFVNTANGTTFSITDDQGTTHSIDYAASSIANPDVKSVFVSQRIDQESVTPAATATDASANPLKFSTQRVAFIDPETGRVVDNAGTAQEINLVGVSRTVNSTMAAKDRPWNVIQYAGTGPNGEQIWDWDDQGGTNDAFRANFGAAPSTVPRPSGIESVGRSDPVTPMPVVNSVAGGGYVAPTPTPDTPADPTYLGIDLSTYNECPADMHCEILVDDGMLQRRMTPTNSAGGNTEVVELLIADPEDNQAFSSTLVALNQGSNGQVKHTSRMEDPASGMTVNAVDIVKGIFTGNSNNGEVVNPELIAQQPKDFDLNTGVSTADNVNIRISQAITSPGSTDNNSHPMDQSFEIAAVTEFNDGTQWRAPTDSKYVSKKYRIDSTLQFEAANPETERPEALYVFSHIGKDILERDIPGNTPIAGTEETLVNFGSRTTIEDTQYTGGMSGRDINYNHIAITRGSMLADGTIALPRRPFSGNAVGGGSQSWTAPDFTIHDATQTEERSKQVMSQFMVSRADRDKRDPADLTPINANDVHEVAVQTVKVQYKNDEGVQTNDFSSSIYTDGVTWKGTTLFTDLPAIPDDLVVDPWDTNVSFGDTPAAPFP